MNILINSYCNFNCPYCFADNKMTEKGAINMTEEDFKTILKVLRTFDIHELRLIGGEPTLAPNFLKFVRMGIEDYNITSILIFSNFSFSHEIAQELYELGRIKPIHYLPNINEFELLIPKYRKNILYNLELLSQTSGLNTIGVNIYRKDMDLKFWEYILVHFKVRNLRYSIAVPNNDILNNDFDFYEYYHQFEPMLLELSAIAARSKVDINCDCNNVPICALSDSALKEIIKTTGSSIICDRLFCGFPVIDVAPDLTISGCFGVNLSEKKYIQDFPCLDEVINYLRRSASNTDNYIARKECLNCNRYLRSGRSCGCKSTHKVKKEDVIYE